MSDSKNIREKLRSIYFTPEQSVVEHLRNSLGLDHRARAQIKKNAEVLVQELRNSPSDGLMEEFLVQYQLSTSEGIALMCLAEAYLRTPDVPTLDELVKDKIGQGDWSYSAGRSQSTLVNLSAWALMIGGHVLQEQEIEKFDLGDRMRQVVQKLGEPIARAAIGQAMRLLGQQFVLGHTIEAAVSRGQAFEQLGYTYSYDMLGEAARTSKDAAKYFEAYNQAIDALKANASNNSVYKNPGISVKLSALHPRYEFSKTERLLKDLVPRLVELIEKASRANIGLTIDAEEADRLDLSLTIMEAALNIADIGAWRGFGMAVQAYSKQACFVIDWFYSISCARDINTTIRLVKGAYWDSEIKNSQVLGMETFPVFTRKESTDLSYLCCAEKLFNYSDRIFPQFATHNAHTAMAVLNMSEGRTFEFQRLHGMGETLHSLIINKWEHPCRIYAPVGVHEDLLAYLVRRLLENGANSSFIHQLRDESIPSDQVAGDPIDYLDRITSFPSPYFSTGHNLFSPKRVNSRGWNLNNPSDVEDLDRKLEAFKGRHWTASPLVSGKKTTATYREVYNPSHLHRKIGDVEDASPELVEVALGAAVSALPDWSGVSVESRARVVEKIADLYELHTAELIALAIMEAGKTRLDGVLEIREAVDFCRYYADQARELLNDSRYAAIGPVVCISPWNFPLAIFTGQIVAALVCGNTVIAKPAEQTSLMASRAVELMHEAGVPAEVLSLLPGDGSVIGNAITRDPRIEGVCFTGSTKTAELIERNLAEYGNALAPLIAETGGLNTMVVDSTALPEQVIRDVVASAYQSAGQRCSALRILCIQEDCAEQILEMLKGAMAELDVGDPYLQETDIGPVIDEDALNSINAHCQRLENEQALIFKCDAEASGTSGYFVPPAAFRLEDLLDLKEEVFGPVLHVVTFKVDEFDDLVDRINQTGFGLTMGIHSRIDSRIDQIVRRARVGNIYINRNQIGAVVGVQPFGGEGKSGTGPKAGGPNYLSRFTKVKGPESVSSSGEHKYADWEPEILSEIEELDWSQWRCRVQIIALTLNQLSQQGILSQMDKSLSRLNETNFETVRLNGPTGENNRLSYRPRGVVLCAGGGKSAKSCIVAQICLTLLASNIALVAAGADSELIENITKAFIENGMPDDRVRLLTETPEEVIDLQRPDVIFFDGAIEEGRPLRKAAAKLDGQRIIMMNSSDDPHLLAVETVVSQDTTAAGGNASLLAAQNKLAND